MSKKKIEDETEQAAADEAAAEIAEAEAAAQADEVEYEPVPEPEAAPSLDATNDQRLPTLAEVNGEEPEVVPTEESPDVEDE